MIISKLGGGYVGRYYCKLWRQKMQKLLSVFNTLEGYIWVTIFFTIHNLVT